MIFSLIAGSIDEVSPSFVKSIKQLEAILLAQAPNACPFVTDAYSA